MKYVLSCVIIMATRKTRKTRRTKQIKYSGIGANKSSIHTKKQFLKIAKKHFSGCISKKCKKYKSCKSKKKYSKKLLKQEKVDVNDYMKSDQECNKCKKKHKCNFEEYIKYSGATSI